MRMDYEESLALMKIDSKKGFERIKGIADDGYIPAISFLGDCYLTGQYTDIDYTSAIQWYSKAVACNDAYSQRMIGTMYLTGRGVPESHSDAFKWFLLAAENGDMLGQFYSAQFLFEGLGTTGNKTEAIRWYTLASNQGHGDSCLRLGDIYAAGTDEIQKDEPKAIKYYQLATKYGTEEARAKFEKLYREELEVRIGQAISKGLTGAQLREFDSITDQREAGIWLDDNKPDYRDIVRDKTIEMEYEFPIIQYDIWNNTKQDPEFANLTDVYEKLKSGKPEELLEAIEDFFASEGMEYQAGRISEEDFYLKTDTRILLQKIIKMKGNSKLKLPVVKEYDRFVHAFKDWKETHEIKAKPWMGMIIESDISIKEAADWVFNVLDVLKIPMCYLTSMDAEEYPNLFFKIRNGELTTFLSEKCIDIEQVTNDIYPIGEEYLLHFDKGSTMKASIVEMVNGDYVAEGIIYNYMREPGKIEINIDNDETFIYFDKQTITPLQELWGTYMLPNLTSNWTTWDRKRLERAYLFEMEYKSLRIPYMANPSYTTNTD